MDTPDPSLLAEALHHSLDGVAVVERDGRSPRIVYANATLAGMLLRFDDRLQGRALDEVEIEASAEPDDTTVGQRVHLRRADGTTFECERWALLLSGARIALYYRPLPRSSTAGAPVSAVDRLSGLGTLEHLMEVLRRDWSIAQRDGRTITLMRIDVDDCRDYREVFGRGATENVLRQVGRAIAASMRRTSDVVARLAEHEFLVLGVSMEVERARQHAETIAGRVRALAIHHPRSSTGRYLTVSIGVVTAVAPRGCGCEALLDAVQQALASAKGQGGNRVAAGALQEGDRG
jgi:diguanylate cyclase (GGDEF)-like protein